jgi:hypothetical protein
MKDFLFKVKLSPGTIKKGNDNNFWRVNLIKGNVKRWVRTEEPIKKQLYLDMKQLQAKTVYQKELINFQKMKLINSILFEVLVPALVFASLVFMPMGVGIAVIAAGLIVAAIANQTLKRFEPKAPSLPDMDEAEYAAFAAAPPLLEISDKPDLSSNTCLLQLKGLFSGGTKWGYARVPTDEQEGIELRRTGPSAD